MKRILKAMLIAFMTAICALGIFLSICIALMDKDFADMMSR